MSSNNGNPLGSSRLVNAELMLNKLEEFRASISSPSVKPSPIRPVAASNSEQSQFSRPVQRETPSKDDRGFGNLISDFQSDRNVLQNTSDLEQRKAKNLERIRARAVQLEKAMHTEPEAQSISQPRPLDANRNDSRNRNIQEIPSTPQPFPQPSSATAAPSSVSASSFRVESLSSSSPRFHSSPKEQPASERQHSYFSSSMNSSLSPLADSSPPAFTPPSSSPPLSFSASGTHPTSSSSPAIQFNNIPSSPLPVAALSSSSLSYPVSEELESVFHEMVDSETRALLIQKELEEEKMMCDKLETAFLELTQKYEEARMSGIGIPAGSSPRHHQQQQLKQQQQSPRESQQLSPKSSVASRRNQHMSVDASIPRALENASMPPQPASPQSAQSPSASSTNSKAKVDRMAAIIKQQLAQKYGISSSSSSFLSSSSSFSASATPGESFASVFQSSSSSSSPPSSFSASALHRASVATPNAPPSPSLPESDPMSSIGNGTQPFRAERTKPKTLLPGFEAYLADDDEEDDDENGKNNNQNSHSNDASPSDFSYLQPSASLLSASSSYSFAPPPPSSFLSSNSFPLSSSSLASPSSASLLPYMDRFASIHLSTSSSNSKNGKSGSAVASAPASAAPVASQKHDSANDEASSSFLRARCIRTVKSKNEGEISMVMGESIRIIDMDDSYYWIGENENGDIGLFPREYVHVVSRYIPSPDLDKLQEDIDKESEKLKSNPVLLKNNESPKNASSSSSSSLPLNHDRSINGDNDDDNVSIASSSKKSANVDSLLADMRPSNATSQFGAGFYVFENPLRELLAPVASASSSSNSSQPQPDGQASSSAVVPSTPSLSAPPLSMDFSGILSGKPKAVVSNPSSLLAQPASPAVSAKQTLSTQLVPVSGMTVEVLEAFDPTEQGEMPLNKGDVIFVLNRYSVGWWIGKNQLRGTVGRFPCKNVRNAFTKERCIEQDISPEIDSDKLFERMITVSASIPAPSPAATPSSVDAAEDRNQAFVFSTVPKEDRTSLMPLLKGGVFLKYSLSSAPVERFLQLSPDLKQLTWRMLDKRDKSRQAIQVVNIHELRRGMNPIHFAALPQEDRKDKLAKDRLCFSVVTKTMSLDLEATSVDTCVDWVRALLHLLKNRDRLLT